MVTLQRIQGHIGLFYPGSVLSAEHQSARMSKN